MASYSVDPLVINDLLPRDTELDFFDSECFISLVAFKFKDTRILGLPVPGYGNFEEINLRFYVKRMQGEELRRGVVFIKEIVPKKAIAWIAQKVYGEPYEAWDTDHQEAENEITYYWDKHEIENRLHVEYQENLGVPKKDSIEEFISEHYWGYTRRSAIRTDEYRVSHPQWEIYDTNYAEIDVDFGASYGERFSFLSDQAPDSIFLAKGSAVEVYRNERLRRVKA